MKWYLLRFDKLLSIFRPQSWFYIIVFGDLIVDDYIVAHNGKHIVGNDPFEDQS